MSNGSPTILGAIISCIIGLVALVLITIAIGPFWDFMASYLLSLPPNPYVPVVMPLFRYLWLFIALAAILCIARVWYAVYLRQEYNRIYGGW